MRSIYTSTSRGRPRRADTLGALSGVKILDLTRALSGPYAAMMLADLGGEVIKIELTGVGDEARKWGPPFAGGSGATFIGFNRNKRSVELDLHLPGDREQFLGLIPGADVVIENFRPGVMSSWGLGEDALRSVNPEIIYCAISGFGQTGPLAQHPAMDLIIQAVSGLMASTGDPTGRPYKAAAPVADVLAGACAAFAILAAIRLRDMSSALGRSIDISMLDCMLSLMGQNVSAIGMSGDSPRRLGNAHPFVAPYDAFRTATSYVVVSLTNDKRWSAFCSLPECECLRGASAFDSRVNRNANRRLITSAVQEVFLLRDAEYWCESLGRLGVPIAPVRTLDEVLKDPHLTERGSLLEIEYPPRSGNVITIPGMPWRDVAEGFPVSSPPTLGQHNSEVFEAVDGPVRDER